MWVGGRCGAWIIPARAGFTAAGPAGRRRRADHPRSRGVYLPGGVQGSCGRGSSPLARGLPSGVGLIEDASGIIPARAGFTGRSARSSAAAGDHPRSRGVYVEHIPVAGHTGGSSPLARGLRVVGHRRVVGVGIIPARAGFTDRRPGAGRSHQDHPRSRGVYFVSCFAFRVRVGSSPLARGLPRLDVTPHGETRIIPARAGFTARMTGARTSGPDHPRSRGVYRPGWRFAALTAGSSPLARGLPKGRGSGRSRARIIPARAGFTALT